MGNKRLKAYQIVIKDNDVSEEYAHISRESFQPAVDLGIIDEIITYEAITPESPHFEEHVNKYNWATSLMLADQQGSNPDDHSPTEKAGMCSHWDLMRMAGETDERFLVLEHDSYLIPEHLELFDELVSIIENRRPHYANIGLFMGCYSLSRPCARWMHNLLIRGLGHKGKFPINCGPYCTLQRLFRTYTTAHLQDYDYDGINHTVIHPWHDCNTLYFGRQCEVPFNQHDPEPHDNRYKVPTTQVVSKSLKVTQDHHGYTQQHIDDPYTRHHYFHVID
jgi:hypothetical protein